MILVAQFVAQLGLLGLGVELIKQYGGKEQVRRTVIASFVPAALARCSI